MQNRGDEVKRVAGKPSGFAAKAGGNNLLSLLMPVAVAIVGSVIVIQMFILGGYVTKDDFTKNFQLVSDTITKEKTDTTQLITALQGGIPSQVNTAVSQSIASVNNQLISVNSQLSTLTASMGNMARKEEVAATNSAVTTLNTKLDTSVTSLASLNTKVDTSASALTQQLSDANNRLVTNNVTLTSLLARVDALEKAKVASNPALSGDITIKTSVLDEGHLNSDNSTTSLVKLVIYNTTTTDLEDVVISVPATIDNSRTTRPTVVSSGWGSWYIKSWQFGDMEIRSNIGFVLKAGEKKNVYLNLTSWAVDYVHGDMTTTIASNADVQLLAYSIK